MLSYAFRNTYMKRGLYVTCICLKKDIMYSCLTALQIVNQDAMSVSIHQRRNKILPKNARSGHGRRSHGF
jgi:hypothetical protein